MDTVPTAAGKIPRVSGALAFADKLGTLKTRLGIGRMNYTVDPGLYALGAPDKQSPVLVTANFKLSFDRLRSAFGGRNAWILVLDTKGINVWCAAGKGTFGTDELTGRLKASGLEKIVSHRHLILPQLSAPGVAAHAVKRACGFSVAYGPIRAGDLSEFMDRGMKATPEMRTKRFPLAERAVLVPMEFIPALKWMAVLLPLFLVLGGVGFSGTFRGDITTHGIQAAFMLTGGLLAGAVLTPLLLPWLPGRAFAAKGAVAGLITGCIVIFLSGGAPDTAAIQAESSGMLLISVALAAYLAMNFTGASDYTSLSGVRREMQWAAPLLIAGATLGLILWTAARFL
ncbi:MAG: hypothetical protein KGY42_05180 [Desulfobacterales bacterium]|nr:hypothetical protein [Desulfobacterales bacterium]MBS3756809.1 hypothetical protein [Desulfobacterales bacterium]